MARPPSCTRSCCPSCTTETAECVGGRSRCFGCSTSSVGSPSSTPWTRPTRAPSGRGARAQLMVHMHAVRGEHVWQGFEAYRAMAARIPVLWPIWLLHGVWPVNALGRRVYRHVADSRRCEVAAVGRTEPAAAWLAGRDWLRPVVVVSGDAPRERGLRREAAANGLAVLLLSAVLADCRPSRSRWSWRRSTPMASASRGTRRT